jgi:hypothetical protein
MLKHSLKNHILLKQETLFSVAVLVGSINSKLRFKSWTPYFFSVALIRLKRAIFFDLETGTLSPLDIKIKAGFT